MVSLGVETWVQLLGPCQGSPGIPAGTPDYLKLYSNTRKTYICAVCLKVKLFYLVQPEGCNFAGSYWDRHVHTVILEGEMSPSTLGQRLQALSLLSRQQMWSFVSAASNME